MCSLTLFFFMMKMSQPLPLCLTLVLYSFSLALMSATLVSKWICYAILLVFLGGMMIIFLYISTLSLSGKSLNLPSPITLLSLTLLIVLLSTLFLTFIENPFYAFMSIPYLPLNGSCLLFLVAYLLMTLFTVVKLTESFKGALFKKW